MKQLRPHDSVLFTGLQDFIKECCHRDMVMAEIGCWIGESTFLFANAVKVIYAIDAWDVNISNEPVLLDSNLFGVAETVFDYKMMKFDNVVKIKDTSIVASRVFGYQTLDLVYIDANHDYQSVLNDIRIWAPKVKIGGLITGHDYTHENGYGVIQAVDEVFGKPDKVFEDTSWSVRVI